MAKTKAKTNGTVVVNDAGRDSLPEGWARTTLDHVVVDVQPGFACGANNRDGDGVPHLRPMNVNIDGEIDLSDVKYIPEDKVKGDRHWLRKGDVLFNNTNSTELVGKTAFYGHTEQRAFSNHLTRIRVHVGTLDATYCAAYLHQCWRNGHFQEICNQHVSQSSVSRTRLLETPLLLPPLAEQKRIVAKVESLLERVNRARERLARVPEILKKFRQSVLAAACSGRLTADWREENTQLESSSAYLSRVIGRDALVEVPSDIDPVNLPEVPESWAWSRCGNICDPDRAITYGVIKLGPPVDEGVPTLRSSDVRWLYIDNNHVKTISEDIASNYSRTFLQGGEILVTVRGTLGGVAVVPDTMAGFNISREVAMLPVVKQLHAHFVALSIASITSQNWLSTLTKGVAYTGINIRDLKLLPIAIPPVDEQKEIVRRVNSLFEIADRIEQRITAATNRTERITQAILAKAFAGELVETEAELARREGRDYEPASVLLERITAQRAAGQKGKPTRSSKRRANADTRKSTT